MSMHIFYRATLLSLVVGHSRRVLEGVNGNCLSLFRSSLQHSVSILLVLLAILSKSIRDAQFSGERIENDLIILSAKLKLF